ncbi:HEXXH motif-containing putative peptide modification protein [Streptomyces olivochromogenes]|uniref:aKG-HExxH-type peptide beta-hydroxylase n=1 Tax=Streptomyces olivochromogenes TaxID=1963 RepID=UPI0036DA6BE0
MRAAYGALGTRSVAGDVHVTAYYGAGDPTAALPTPSVPLVVPKRRVPRKRLRGRNRLVDEITDAVTRRVAGDPDEHAVWLLSGMGGSGKTTVALEAAHRLTGAVTHIWWVSGADGEGLHAALRAVAFAAGATPSDFHGAPHPADVLWKRLEGLTVPWLLVLDNIDDPAVLAAEKSRTAEGNGWLREPAHPRGTVLVTSRDSRAERWGQWVHLTNVEPLSSEDGAAVLQDLARQAGDAAQARELAEHLGGLPLALDLAGSYLARADDVPLRKQSMPRSFADYRCSFDAHLADMASDPDGDLTPDVRARRTLRSTFELSLDLLHGWETHLARPLLRLLSAFGPAPLPYEELLDADLLAATELFPGATLDLLNKALLGLHGLKLITLETPPDTQEGSDEDAPRWLTIHPMVRKASRAHDDFAAQTVPLLRLAVVLLGRVTGPLATGNPAHWPQWAAIAPHGVAARLLLSEAERRHLADANLVRAASEPALSIAWYQAHSGMFTEAVGELETLHRIRARWFGEQDPATIAVGLPLALALRDGGHLGESERWYGRLAEAAESLPAGHAYRQSIRTGLARTLAQQGRYEAAEAQLTIALRMRRTDPRATERGVLRIRADLARLADSQGRPDEAISELREVRRRLWEIVGPGDLEFLAAGVSLIRALRNAGRAAEAEALAEDVVREHEQFLASDHPDLLVARHERARLRRDHARESEPLKQVRDEFTDIWRISERRLGHDHPNTLATRHELATVWHLLGDSDRAAEHFRAVLAAGTRRLGPRHPNVVVCARNLARVLAESDDADAETPQGAASVNPSSPTPGPPPTGPADPTTPEPDAAVPARALERQLNRFVHADRTVSDFGGGGGGSYSSSDYLRSSQSNRTYRPAPVEPVKELDLFERPLVPVVLGPAVIQTLAAGEEDRPLIARLRDQQQVGRIESLRNLVERAGTFAAGRNDGSFDVQAARELLVRADRADARVVAEVLMHPAVGRWMSRTLRGLHTVTGQSAPALHEDLAHLHCVAAAAALRAGITFRLSLPLRDGYVVLPTLGAADLREGRGETAYIHVTARDTYLARGRRHLPLRAGADGIPRPWPSAHRVRTPVGSGRFDFVLDDLDPHRVSDGPLPPSPLDATETEGWERLIHDAGTLLSRVAPQRADALAAALTALTPRARQQGGAVSSSSSVDAFGGVVISEPPDGVELAASLVHEFQHMKLHALLDGVSLYDERAEPHDEAYYAPWRDDPRPLPGLFQGVFAFLGVADFWRRLALTAEGETLRRAQFQLAYWGTQTRDAHAALSSSPRLTGQGRDFVRTMGDSAGPWSDLAAVPGDIRILAREAAVAHRTRWRLHHLRPDAAAVAGLADAWRPSGAAPAADRPVGVSLCPDSGAVPSNGYAVLLCRVATAPDLTRDWQASTGERGPSGDRVDPSDLARLRGSFEEAGHLAVDQVTEWPERPEPWVRLGLALRRSCATRFAPDSTVDAAAGALTHRPELVRAVHARLTERTGTPPDPVALAGWLGAGVPSHFLDMPKTDVAFRVGP